MSLREWKPSEFARYLQECSQTDDKKFAFFLGAGCSISSGIPSAGTLVDKYWLPKLYTRQTGKNKIDDAASYNKWLSNLFPEYSANKAGEFYGEVINKVFPTEGDRQREIEELCQNQFPNFGYATLASIISSNDGHNPHSNLGLIMTTNFDNLIADAFYLFTAQRPKVISDAGLAKYIQASSKRPLIMKLHGDHQLSPRNTKTETSQLDPAYVEQLNQLLNGCGLVFIGYSGFDESIKQMLEQLPPNALRYGVYWVNGTNPIGESGLSDWLKVKEAIWVNNKDFDELMLYMYSAFNLEPINREHIDTAFSEYEDKRKSLLQKVSGRKDGQSIELKTAAGKVADELEGDLGWYSFAFKADLIEKTDPDKANKIYQQGLSQFPEAAGLIGNYALFLSTVKKDYEEAEIYYKKAIELEPESANFWGNYALFLKDIKKDYEEAEIYYKKAIELEPESANFWGNYALFLSSIRKEYEEAEAYYKKAIELAPNHANKLSNYANFLNAIKKDYEEAETYYKKAIELAPTNANYLGNYALYLSDTKKDYEEAETYYKKAIELAPTNANNLGNYGHNLISQNDLAQGLNFINRAIQKAQLPQNDDLLLECKFYLYANDNQDGANNYLSSVKDLLNRGVRSFGWDFSSNIKLAKKQNHPELEWLQKLADVISEKEDISILNDWKAWQEA